MRTPSGGRSASSMYFFGAGAAFALDRAVVCRFGRDELALSDARSDLVVLLAMSSTVRPTADNGPQ